MPPPGKRQTTRSKNVARLVKEAYRYPFAHQVGVSSSKYDAYMSCVGITSTTRKKLWEFLVHVCGSFWSRLDSLGQWRIESSGRQQRYSTASQT
ncbi:hypothetical protein PAXRUDRAFT_699384 [Paxillus rubicundulus Ve08.2h10]|uniref:Unplaced genomic scaffold scaffold_756, whole genome shotgun sequence n=1 Tax=Paxillus rubicundulus Ve08.2h10 TaxID=930991 RepID=A0A0D0DP20_9AGAM|nr:hypothetical protein PAXRUDRAFT_699384 [Paxillus rubicundulus Ve08.2h10]